MAGHAPPLSLHDMIGSVLTAFDDTDDELLMQNAYDGHINANGNVVDTLVTISAVIAVYTACKRLLPGDINAMGAIVHAFMVAVQGIDVNALTAPARTLLILRCARALRDLAEIARDYLPPDDHVFNMAHTILQTCFTHLRDVLDAGVENAVHGGGGDDDDDDDDPPPRHDHPEDRSNGAGPSHAPPAPPAPPAPQPPAPKRSKIDAPCPVVVVPPSKAPKHNPRPKQPAALPKRYTKGQVAHRVLYHALRINGQLGIVIPRDLRASMFHPMLHRIHHDWYIHAQKDKANGWLKKVGPVQKQGDMNYSICLTPAGSVPAHPDASWAADGVSMQTMLTNSPVVGVYTTVAALLVDVNAVLIRVGWLPLKEEDLM